MDFEQLKREVKSLYQTIESTKELKKDATFFLLKFHLNEKREVLLKRLLAFHHSIDGYDFLKAVLKEEI